MTKDEAFELLNASSSHQRLTAARALGRLSSKRDLPKLRARLRIERVSFVRRALIQIIERLSTGVASVPTHQEDASVNEEQDGRLAYAKAVEWVTNSLLHEILPRIGMIKVEARRSLKEYDASSLKRKIDDLTSVLKGIEEIKKAAVSEAFQPVNIFDLIEDVANHEGRLTPLPISIQGERSLVTQVDPNLLRLALSNGIRNALEATASTGWKAPVIVAFGNTEVDNWITVLDSGPGLPGAAERAFEIGKTTKAGHRGFGLAIIKQAMSTLEGTATLQPAHGGGARLELRWFR